MTKNVLVTVVGTSVLVLDQLSKWWIRRTLEPGETIVVLDSCLQIIHARNPGGAFSLFAGTGDAFRIPFFLVASVLAIGVLIYFLRQVQPHQRILQFALAGLMGGALGNLVDRVAMGYVTDFIDAYWRSYHWPAFNVADSFITIGVCILLGHSLFGSNPPAQDT